MGNNQSENGFGRSTTAAIAAGKVDLAGKVIVVTGCSAGIGVETVRVLLLHNAHVVMACRNKEKMAKAAKEIEENVKKISPNSTGKITQMVLNLSSLKGVKQFAQDFLATGLPLHMLVLNAGIMVPPLEFTEDGFESQFGTNHLAHFALTNLLLQHMVNTCGDEGRIIAVSSSAHNIGKIDFEDLHYKKSRSYGTGWEAYGQSKLANILFARELDKKLKEIPAASKIRAFSLHPGEIITELQRTSNFSVTVMSLFSWATKSVEQGAATTVYLACTDIDKLKRGEFHIDCNFAESSVAGKDMKVAAKLWTVSEELTGVKFPLTV